MLSVSGTCGKASGGKLSLRPKTRELGEPMVQTCVRAGEGRVRCPRSISEAGRRGQFLLPLPFTLFRPSVNWMVPTPVGEDSALCGVHDDDANLIQTLSETTCYVGAPWLARFTLLAIPE